MAGQLIVAYSSLIKGAGIVAAGPYYCAEKSLITAELDCMSLPSAINLNELYTATENFYSQKKIDNPSYLSSARIYLYSGTKDTVVVPGVVQKAQQYFQKYVSAVNITFVSNILSVVL